MANIVECTLTMSGSEATIAEVAAVFRAAIAGEGNLALVEVERVDGKDDTPSVAWCAGVPFDEDPQVAAAEANHNVLWSLGGLTVGPTALRVSFETRWSPPTRLARALAVRYREAKGDIGYAEYDVGYSGTLGFDKGESWDNQDDDFNPERDE